MNGDDVRAAAEQAVAFLEPLTDRDWSVPVPDMDFTVASVVAHAATCPLRYAIGHIGGPGDGAFDLKVLPDAEPARLLVSLRTTAALSAMTVDTLPAAHRGFHPSGSPDGPGFAAMSCDEMLVHTRDAGTGLGAEFAPDPALAGRVLARLFPWYQPVPDPWTALLYANGRVELADRPRLSEHWQWHCAPLSEWDGTRPPSPPSPPPA